MTRTAAAHSAPPGGGCSWKRVRPALRRRRRGFGTVRPVLRRSLTLCSPCRPKAPLPRRLAPALPRPQQWGRMFRMKKPGFESAAPTGLEQLLSARPAPPEDGRGDRGGRGEEFLHPVCCDSPRLSQPHPAPSVRPVRPRNFCGRDSASRRGATAGTRRSGAAWTYSKIITIIH